MTGKAPQAPRLFVVRADRELEVLPERWLLAYIRDAYAAGQPAAAQRALGTFASRERAFITRVISRRAPAGEVGDLVSAVVADAARSSFCPASRPHFRAWVTRVARRRVADYFDARARRPQAVAMPDRDSLDTPVGPEPANDGGINVHRLAVHLADRRRRSGLSIKHQAVLELHVDRDLPAAQVARLIPGMSADNVAQIRSRHRNAVTRAIEADAA